MVFQSADDSAILQIVGNGENSSRYDGVRGAAARNNSYSPPECAKIVGIFLKLKQTQSAHRSFSLQSRFKIITVYNCIGAWHRGFVWYLIPAPIRTLFYSKPKSGVHVAKMIIYDLFLFNLSLATIPAIIIAAVSANSSSMSLSVAFIFGARNFRSRRIMVPKAGARKWRRFMAPVSGAYVMGKNVVYGLCLGQVQRFYEEPSDTAVIRGHDALLLCSVVNVQGPLQWMKNGFGLGPGPLFDGYPRYRIVQQLTQNGIELSLVIIIYVVSFTLRFLYVF